MRRSRIHAQALALACAILLATQLACVGSDLLGGGFAVRERVDGDWIRLYFTNPHHSGREVEPHGGLDRDLASLIRQAETSVDVAAYDFDLETLADALVAIQDRGVDVRVVTESDNVGGDALTKIRDAGIPVIEDQSDSGRMHHKFIIVDDQWLWTGSWNLSESGTYRNNNNAVLIASPGLAENYTNEFEEMVAGRFGPSSLANTPNPRVVITRATAEGRSRSVAVENYFSPDDGVADEIIAEIGAARERIRFLAFIVTSERIVDALVERSRAGVVVQGVLEERNAGQLKSQHDRLRSTFRDVLSDGNPYAMHHKVIIIDDATVITGSYNFTRSAEAYNDEDVLIIHDPDVAALFVEEFGRIYEQARRAD